MLSVSRKHSILGAVCRKETKQVKDILHITKDLNLKSIKKMLGEKTTKWSNKFEDDL